MTPYRVLITGSRDWRNWGLLYLALDHAFGEAVALKRPFVMINGMCRKGADFQGLCWRRGMLFHDFPIDLEPHPALWNEYGKRAGYLRNAEMVNSGADVCLAFIRNSSPGSTHCATLAFEAKIETIIFREDGRCSTGFSWFS